MPAILIETRKQYTKKKEIQLIDAVHSALQVSFKILPTDKVVRLVVHEAHRFATPLNLEKPDYFTYISIDAFSGRSIEAKRMLYREIVKNLKSFGIPNDHVLIVLKEGSAENFGVQEGKAASDVYLGFKVNV